MYLIYFVNAFQSSITGNLTPFVTSSFQEHSLIPVITIVSSSLNAVTYLPVAKALDTFGRPQGFGIMATLAVIGLIMMGATKNITTYCAAQVGQ